MEATVSVIKGAYMERELAKESAAKLSGQNPARNVFYVEGILKRWRGIRIKVPSRLRGKMRYEP